LTLEVLHQLDHRNTSSQSRNTKAPIRAVS
jgi:hypothetical protein